MIASSSIVSDKAHSEKLHTWVKESMNSNVSFKLLWKGSTDGFKAATFHTKCDNQGPTLTVIKSQHDRVFGGFTSVPWTSSGKCKKDATAFIYSLTHGGKYAQQRNDNSIVDDCIFGPIFGSAGYYDIYINNDCNKPDYNWCRANQTYQLPAGADNSFLAGSQYYSVKEIEVYAVTKQP